MPSLFSEGGSRPASRPASLLRQRKQAKKGDPGARDPCAALRGNLRHPAHKAGAVKLTSRSMLHMKRCVQTITASQSTKRLCPAAQTPVLWAGCHRRSHKGECGDREPGPCGCCVAFAGSIDFIAARTRIQGSRGIKHSNFSNPSQLWQAVRPYPFGCACGTGFRLRARLPQDSLAS